MPRSPRILNKNLQRSKVNNYETDQSLADVELLRGYDRISDFNVGGISEEDQIERALELSMNQSVLKPLVNEEFKIPKLSNLDGNDDDFDKLLCDDVLIENEEGSTSDELHPDFVQSRNRNKKRK